jgi:hypothetical protein
MISNQGRAEWTLPRHIRNKDLGRNLKLAKSNFTKNNFGAPFLSGISLNVYVYV